MSEMNEMPIARRLFKPPFKVTEPGYVWDADTRMVASMHCGSMVARGWGRLISEFSRGERKAPDVTMNLWEAEFTALLDRTGATTAQEVADALNVALGGAEQ